MASLRGEGSPIVAVGSLSDAVGEVTARTGERLSADDKLAEFVGSLLGGLHNIGVDDAHVMPDLDGLARMLKWQYETGTLRG